MMFLKPSNFYEMQTVREALTFLFGQKTLNKYKDVPDAYLIKTVAEALGYRPQKVLFNCSYLLGIQPLLALEAPSSELIEKIGYNIDYLKTNHIVPQPYKDKIAVALADPTKVNIDEWLGYGVPVYLTYGDQIDAIWPDFFAADLVLKDALVALTEVIIEAQKEGALDVFLGSLGNDICDYAVGPNTVRKQIDDMVYRSLLTYLNVANKLVLSLPGLENYVVNITKFLSGAKTVIFISLYRFSGNRTTSRYK
ncbi:MAG: hypothetical protein IT292_02650 [Deltaproteobacteria bacterium]|nr:hypothetical protein [Deltaproteobacteria bacterium]